MRGSLASAALLGLLLLHTAGCSSYVYHHAIQGDARQQIWLADTSQVKVRAAQSRLFETADRSATIEAVVAVLQDLDFQIEVLDEALGIVSGKKFLDEGGPSSAARDPNYQAYDDVSLLIFSRTYRSWGPFVHRTDLVRLTVTVRQRNEAQLLVRASAQYFVQAVEAPEPYQLFFSALEKALFLDAQTRVSRRPSVSRRTRLRSANQLSG
jgi:hypothetical protein